jgi:hypothetical protein
LVSVDGSLKSAEMRVVSAESKADVAIANVAEIEANALTAENEFRAREKKL